MYGYSLCQVVYLLSQIVNFFGFLFRRGFQLVIFLLHSFVGPDPFSEVLLITGNLCSCLIEIILQLTDPLNINLIVASLPQHSPQLLQVVNRVGQHRIVVLRLIKSTFIDWPCNSLLRSIPGLDSHPSHLSPCRACLRQCLWIPQSYHHHHCLRPQRYRNVSQSPSFPGVENKMYDNNP